MVCPRDAPRNQHLVIISVFYYSLSNLENVSVFELLVIPAMLIGGNFFVWAFHKYPLHRPFKLMPMAYKIHTLSHHYFYTDEAIIYRDKRDFIILFFPVHFVLPVNGILFPAIAYFARDLWSNVGKCLLPLGIYGSALFGAL